uniref:Fatty acid hydroxylase domain-containing protein n=1 Tax=Cryptomonas curvata TaxID=233186 RepID=A0A7S0N9Q5_9CRYP|mmetsp:Transcript_9648/g.20619  ORF Transcript_9648/g.20619 Transcript_9648/m.20619 type:complete len:268 (+) Transcript_9648:8-811(+)
MHDDAHFVFRVEPWSMITPTFMDYRPWEASTWLWWQYVIWVVVVWGGLEVVSYLIDVIPGLFKLKQIRIRGKHLDELGPWDRGFVAFNKMSTCFFAYHCVRFAWFAEHIAWELDRLTLANTLLSLTCLFAVYDLLYHTFHRVLHMRFAYRYIHKHHHNQHAPTRGNLDAVNVHPIEFLVGEYLHLLALVFIPCHVLTAVVFVMGGGILASLNHTRHDLGLYGLWEVVAHDQHHVVPNCNYSQYTTFWDRLLGTYLPHPDSPARAKAT